MFGKVTTFLQILYNRNLSLKIDAEVLHDIDLTSERYPRSNPMPAGYQIVSEEEALEILRCCFDEMLDTSD